MNYISILSALAFVILLNACGQEIIFSHNVNIEGPWDYKEKINYEFEIIDTVPAYDIILHTTHTKDFPYQNIYTKMTTIFPDNTKTNHVVSLDLTDKLNKWTGDCSGNSCTVPIMLSEHIFFKKPGKYIITVEQYGRQDTLNGVISLELIISKSTKND